jgi:thiol-disulfide isomerase/thioredoxin
MMLNLIPDKSTIVVIVIMVCIAVGLYLYNNKSSSATKPLTETMATLPEQSQMPQLPQCSACRRNQEIKQQSSMNETESESIDGFDEDGKYIINFHTTWCPASRKFKPLWDKFTKHNAHPEFKTMDVVCDDTNNKLYRKFYQMGVIQYFPTVLVYYKGQPFVYELRSFEDIEIKHINEYVSKIKNT